MIWLPMFFTVCMMAAALALFEWDCSRRPRAWEMQQRLMLWVAFLFIVWSWLMIPLRTVTYSTILHYQNTPPVSQVDGGYR